MRLRFALPAAVLFLTSTTYAAPITLSGSFAGTNENPATPSAGSGTATVILDPTLHTLVVDVIFNNLLATIPGTSTPSGTTASHIHCCVAEPGNAGVATAVPTFPGFPLGVDSGTYHQTFDLLSAASYNPAFVTANGGTVATADVALENGLLNGQTYLNIHTNAFGGGEVRAFLLTPEPSSAALALSALAALALVRKRFRR